jgi:hypothetical protein
MGIQATHAAFWLATGRWPTGQLNHTCDNRVCVRLEHLYDGTPGDNWRDSYVRGRWSPPCVRGEGNGQSKLTDEKVKAIRKRHEAGESQVRLGAAFGVSGQVVNEIVRGLAWKHVPLSLALEDGEPKEGVTNGPENV